MGLVACAHQSQYQADVKYATDLSKYVSMTEFENFWQPEIKVSPRYPRWHLEKEQPGCVLVGMSVNSDGLVDDTEVVKQWPDSSSFAKEAVRAVSQFRFKPTPVNKNNTPMWSVHLIYFTFEGAAPAGNALNAMCAA